MPVIDADAHVIESERTWEYLEEGERRHKPLTIRIADGQGRPQDLDNLLNIATNMEGKTICVFADAAAWPVQSYITKFRDEFEFHIREKRCNLSPALAEVAIS